MLRIQTPCPLFVFNFGMYFWTWNSYADEQNKTKDTQIHISRLRLDSPLMSCRFERTTIAVTRHRWRKKTKTKDNCDWPKWDTVLNPVGLYLLLCFVVVVVVGWLFGRCACRISSCFISWHEFDAVEITIIIVVVTYEWLTRALFRVPAPNLTHCRHSCPLDLSLSLLFSFSLFCAHAHAPHFSALFKL